MKNQPKKIATRTRKLFFGLPAVAGVVAPGRACAVGAEGVDGFAPGAGCVFGEGGGLGGFGTAG